MANGIVMGLASKKPALFSQYSRAAEIPVLVSQYSVMFSRRSSRVDDRARPPVGDDQRQRALVRGADVEEMNIQPVDLGDEIGQGVQFCIALAPVVLGPPVAREVLHEREPHALGVVGDRLLVRPPGRIDAPAQLGELHLRKIDPERADYRFAGHRISSLSR